MLDGPVDGAVDGTVATVSAVRGIETLQQRLDAELESLRHGGRSVTRALHVTVNDVNHVGMVLLGAFRW